MMKGSDIGIQEKKAKLFNGWESQNGVDMEVDELKVERLAKTQDPLALMANSNNPYIFPAPHQDQSSFNQNYLKKPIPNPEDITDPTTAMNMAIALMAKAFKLNYSTPTNNNQRISSNPRNRQIAQPGNLAGYNDVIGNQVIQNAVQNPRVQNVGNQNGLIGVQGNGNQNQIGNGNLVAARAKGNASGQNGNQIRCYNCRGVGHYARHCTVRPRRRDAAYLQTQLLIAQKEEAGIQLQAEEYDLMAAAADLDEIKEVNANCILMANLQQASTSGTQTDSAPIYDTDGSAEKMALGYQNPFYLKQAQKKQQSLYDGKVLLEKHDPPVVHDSEETLQLAQKRESIESYYHCFLKLMNDLKRNKHFPEKIGSNLKFLNNLQPEWSRHVTIVHQTKDLHTADYTQLYDFLKYNQKEVDELKVERLAKTQDPLALMENSNNPYIFPAPHQEQSSFNQNYLQQPIPNPEDITDPTTAMNMALTLMAKALKLNYLTPTNNNQRISSNPRNGQIAQPGQNTGNLAGYNDVIGNQIGNGNLVVARAEGNASGQNENQIRCYNCRGVGHYARNCTVRPRRRDAAYLQTQLLIAPKEEAGIQLQAEEYDLMDAATDLDEIKEVNANCILMANLQQASTSGTPTDSAPIYDTDGSAEKMALEETLQLAQDSRDKMKQMNKEIKPTNYTNINHLLGIFVPQKALSCEELYFSNNSKTANVLKSFLIPNEDLSDDTTPSVARKFLNEVKSTILTLQRVVKQRMTIETHNWASSAHQELHKIVREENFPIVNQVDARVQNFKIQFLKEAAKFVRDFKSLANEADASLAKHKALELEIKRLLKAVDMSKNTKFAKQPIMENLPKIGKTNALSKPVTSNSVSIPQAFKGVNNDKVIAPGMFRTNPSKTSREEKQVPNTVSASAKTKPITVSQPPVITTKDVNSDVNGLSSTGVENTKTIRPHPRRNTKNDRVPSVSKSSRSKNKEAKVEEHHRNLLLSKNNKHISSACNSSKIDSQDVISKVVCAKCKKCLISVNHDECVGNLKLLINFIWKFMGTVRFENDHVAAILGFCNLQGGNILITRVYFIEGLGHNLFLVGQFCDSDLEAFQSLNIIRNIFVLPVSKEKARASHPPKPVPNSRQRLHLLHMDLCGPMRIASINGKRYVLVIVDDYSRYTWVHFLISKDEAPEVIIKFLKRITVFLQSPVIIIRTDNVTEFKNQVLNEYFDTVGISHQMSSVRTPQQNGVVERRNRTLVEAARTMLIFSRAPLFLWAEAIATACFTQNRSIIHRRFNKTPYELISGRKPNISFLHVFGALCYPKNDRKDIGKHDAKGDIGFFIGYSADSYAYRVYNRQTKKIIETMNVSFDELSAMAFKQSSSKPGLNRMTSGHISSGLDLTYAPSTITTQQPSEGKLDLLFEAMYDDYIGGQLSATTRTVPPA
nr:integrase, catalytic region, zinc finger, CCHC-type, peptidase aspartic, catalytic [Tanacetum cinerariifolium]